MAMVQILAVVAAVLAMVGQGAEACPAVVKVVYPAVGSSARLKVGKACYPVDLELDANTKGTIANLDLVVHGRGGRDWLETRWHGYQRDNFAASDFVKGPAQSTYGAVRVMRLKGERVTIRTVAVEVVPLVGGTWAFKRLVLSVKAGR